MCITIRINMGRVRPEICNTYSFAYRDFDTDRLTEYRDGDTKAGEHL
jgi:hypothetical protein